MNANGEIYHLRPPLFRVFIHRDDLTPEDSSSRLDASDATPSSSSRSSSSEPRLDTYLLIPLVQKQLGLIVRRSVRMKRLIENARKEQEPKDYVVLEDNSQSDVSSASLRFMVDNLSLEKAMYAGSVQLEDLSKQANSLWDYQCDMTAFVHGWDAVDKGLRKIKRQSPTPLVPRNSGDRCWFEQPWGLKDLTPLMLLNIAWVLGHNHAHLNEIFKAELITAVWDSTATIPTSVAELRSIPQKRKEELTRIFDDFKAFAADAGNVQKYARAHRTQQALKDSLKLDFSGLCIEGSSNQTAKENFDELEHYTPYQLLRDIECCLLGRKLNAPPVGEVRHVRGGSKGSRGSDHEFREYPRDIPDIKWAKLLSTFKSYLSNALDFEGKAYRDEISRILDIMEANVQARQVRLLQTFMDTRTSAVLGWLRILGDRNLPDLTPG